MSLTSSCLRVTRYSLSSERKSGREVNWERERRKDSTLKGDVVSERWGLLDWRGTNTGRSWLSLSLTMLVRDSRSSARRSSSNGSTGDVMSLDEGWAWGFI